VNTIDEMIEVLQAMKGGKKLQVMLRGKWMDRDGIDATVVPDFRNLNYRVKREPRRRWCVEVKRLDSGYTFTVMYNNEQEANDYRALITVGTSYRAGEVYEVVEVMK
jgi:hypothetical protein